MRKQFLTISTVILGCVIFISSCSKKTEEQVVEESDDPVAFDTSFIDPSIGPCDNFYDYAIGNWRKNNPIPETESRWMAFNILYEENRQKLLDILDDLMQNKYSQKGSDQQLIKDFYTSGMNFENRNAQGTKPLEPILSEIKGAESANDLFGNLPPLGISTPIGGYISADKTNSKMNAIYTSQSGLSLPDRDYYLSEDEKFVNIRNEYVKHINKMASLAGIAMDGQRILELETEIAEISWDRTAMRDPKKTFNRKHITDWNASLSNIDIESVMAARGFKKIDSLVVAHPSFFEGLNTLVSKFDFDRWQEYANWHALNSFSTYLTEDIEKEHFNFYSATLKGTKEMKPDNERIFNSLNNHLGQPLGKLYVAAHFDEESKKYVSNMIEDLRSAYKVRIENLDWMGDQTKKRALRKLEAFTYKIGYPEEWINYSKVNIDPKNYVQNIANIRLFNYHRMLDKQGKPVDKKEWHMTPQTVNAYYSSSNNEIVFPAGILQPPFFHKTFDDAINYGGIGAVIGHEFSHGFDDQGSKYDWDGNLNDWWEVEDRERFETLAAKLGTQYSSYEPLPGMFIKGEMTMGENIADLGGITLAYEALKIKYESTGEPLSIDGFSWQQRFFFGWANVWKGNITENELMNRLKSDVHSPGEFRVLGPLVNFTPWYEAFNCSGGALHKHEDERIKIW
jgi:predicted metalloendopeptidase